jgi:prepilin-type N-terminal cleavage/methylation domain-containing protein
MLKRMLMKMADERTSGAKAGEIRKTIAGRQGFTLLEILVVLTIMGFLIAMVAPRLAGISSDASGTVCDTNKGRIGTYVSAFYEKFNHYPNHLTNMVMTDGATLAAANGADAGYQIPYCSDDDPDNGPEVIHGGHNKQYKFMIHRLNQAEVDELKSLGITEVYNLNDYAADADGLNGAAANGRSAAATDGDRVSNWGNVTAVTDQRPSMEPCPLEAGVGVAMCGCGIPAVGGTEFTYVQVERGWAEEDIFARIAFALGPESELVSSGIVTNAAHCPGSIQNADNFSYGAYYLILPRLEATADRLETATAYNTVWGAGTLSYASLSSDDLEAVSWPKDGPAPSTNYGITANDEHFKVRSGLKLGDAMEPWDYDTNRQRYDEVWGIDIMNANHVLNGG